MYIIICRSRFVIYCVYATWDQRESASASANANTHTWMHQQDLLYSLNDAIFRQHVYMQILDVLGLVCQWKSAACTWNSWVAGMLLISFSMTSKMANITVFTAICMRYSHSEFLPWNGNLNYATANVYDRKSHINYYYQARICVQPSIFHTQVYKHKSIDKKLTALSQEFAMSTQENKHSTLAHCLLLPFCPLVMVYHFVLFRPILLPCHTMPCV